MPELPEIEVIRRSLLPHLVGRTIQTIVFNRRRLRLPVPRRELGSLIRGNRVEAVERRAKYLLIQMSSAATMVIHLGMSGRLALFADGSPPALHDHLRFLLDDSRELRFNDPRRFGSVQVLAPPPRGGSALFAGMGPEPFSDDFSATYLLGKARGRGQPIKNFLMDSRVVGGIGNIYANEILFAAGIQPARAAGTLGKKAWARVVEACRHVLEKAIRCGGTTISDFADGLGESGTFQCELMVYGRQGANCRICARPIVRIVQAGRATYYCPGCQRSDHKG